MRVDEIEGKARKDADAIAITTGMGTASMQRRTRPTKAETQHEHAGRESPITSGKARWVSASPTSTVSGIDHNRTSGSR